MIFKKNNFFYTIIPVIFTLITGIIFYNFIHGKRVYKEYVPLSEAAHNIKFEATMAHLWFEEIISGDTNEHINQVWQHQEHAEWYALAMLNGGEKQDIKYFPLKSPELRSKISDVLILLNKFKSISEKRFSEVEISRTGSEIDQRYDDIFLRFINLANEVEEEIHRKMFNEFERFIFNEVSLIILSIIMFIIILYMLWTFDQYRSLNIRSLNDKNLRLEKEIEERLAAEDALSESEKRYTRLVDNAKDTIFRLSIPEGKCQFMSIASKDTFGYAPHEFYENEYLFQKIIDKDWKEFAKKEWEKIVEGKIEPFYEFKIKSKNGESRWVYQRNLLVNDDFNKPVAIEAIVTDITSKKESDEEKLKLHVQMQHAQKLESLGVLAGGIAHDFNNLLMAILGNSDIALQDLSPHSPVKNNIEEIEKAARRAAALSKQMLAYSGKGRFEIVPIDLNDLVIEMTHMLEVTISKKTVLKFNCADNLPLFEGDATQVRQIIMNLITNASEAIGDKSGIIAVSTGAMYCNKDYIETTEFVALTGDYEPIEEGVYCFVEVADTGCGMEKDTQLKLFDPFFTTKFTGRGLGMAAVQGIVRGHKGAVKVYSEIGKGTTFKILFPVYKGSDSCRLPQNINGEESSWKQTGTILIADDEETVCAVGKMMLEKIGFNVLTAPDGRKAVEIFQKKFREIDCVILDLTMPHLSGDEAYREMRLIDPKVKVIISSGYNEQEATQNFVGKGISGFIQKPYSSALLTSKLKDLFEKE